MKLTVITYQQGWEFKAYICDIDTAHKKVKTGQYEFAKDTKGGDGLEAYLLTIYARILEEKTAPGRENDWMKMLVVKDKWYKAEVKLSSNINAWPKG